MARRYRLLSVSAVVRRAALRKGVRSGSRGWLTAGLVLWGFRSFRLFFGRHEQVITTEKLVAGQFLSVEAMRPLTRKQRKDIKRAS